MRKGKSNLTPTSPQETQERLRRENAKKPPNAAYSLETHDAARDLWIAGWNDERIAQALGIPRRATVTEWSRRENWPDVQKDYRRRILDKTVEAAAENKAEANARHLTQIDELWTKLRHELQKTDVRAKSVEGLVRSVVTVMAFERQILVLDDASQPEAVAPRSSFLDEYESLLERTKNDPAKVTRMSELYKQHLDLQAEMRALAAKEGPSVDADTGTS